MNVGSHQAFFSFSSLSFASVFVDPEVCQLPLELAKDCRCDLQQAVAVLALATCSRQTYWGSCNLHRQPGTGWSAGPAGAKSRFGLLACPHAVLLYVLPQGSLRGVSLRIYSCGWQLDRSLPWFAALCVNVHDLLVAPAASAKVVLRCPSKVFKIPSSLVGSTFSVTYHL